jgi:transcriptional regulator with XRE-family HTH domain
MHMRTFSFPRLLTSPEMGGRIRTLREERRITQVELARRIGVSQMALYSWEKGTHAPQGMNLHALAREHGVPIDYITTGRQTPKVKVYKVKAYNVTTDETLISRRMATEKGAAIMHGEIIAESGIEIDADRLEPGEEWTARDFVP